MLLAIWQAVLSRAFRTRSFAKYQMAQIGKSACPEFRHCGRRGAQMATFDVGHPDVIEFIRAKREHGRLRQFNLSLLITREFIEAVQNDADWPLAFPIQAKEAATDGIDLNDPRQVIWRDWPTT